MSNYHLFATCSLFSGQHFFNCTWGGRMHRDSFRWVSIYLMFLLRLTSPVCQIIPSLDFRLGPPAWVWLHWLAKGVSLQTSTHLFFSVQVLLLPRSNHFTPAVTPLGHARENRLFAICVAFSSQNLWGCVSSPTPSIVSLGRGTFQSAMAMVKFTIVSLGTKNCDTPKRTARINKLKFTTRLPKLHPWLWGVHFEQTAPWYEMTLWVTLCQDEYIRLLWTGLTNNSMSHFHRFAHLPLKYALFRRTLLKGSVSVGLKTANNAWGLSVWCRAK